MRARLTAWPQSDNSKTGNVPTFAVGRDMTETEATCVGCALRPSCYSHHGTGRMAARASQKSAKHSIVSAFADRRRDARMARMGSIGDPARADRSELQLVATLAKENGLALVGYTHFALTDGADLRGQYMASVDTLSDALSGRFDGWRMAIVAPEGTTGTFRALDGRKIVQCPATAAPGRVTCNTCGGKAGPLCDASREGPHVYFPEHGPAKRRLPVVRA